MRKIKGWRSLSAESVSCLLSSKKIRYLKKYQILLGTSEPWRRSWSGAEKLPPLEKSENMNLFVSDDGDDDVRYEDDNAGRDVGGVDKTPYNDGEDDDDKYNR